MEKAKAFPVFLTVTGEEQRANALLEQALRSELAKYPDIRLVASRAEAAVTMMIFMARTKNNPKNPDGYSLAIAHTPSSFPRYLDVTRRHIADKCPSADPGVMSVMEKIIVQMVAETPPLSHLNVAHIDALEKGKMQVVAATLVKDLSERLERY